MGLLLLLGAGYLFQTSQFELAPKEDQGFILGAFQGPPTATSQQMQTYAAQAFEVAKKYPEIEKIYQITGVPTPNQGIAGVILKPWDERKRGAEQVQDQLQKAWGDIPGTRVALFQPPSLPGAQGMPMQFVIKTTESFDRLHEVSEAVLAKARQSGMFFYVDSDLKVDKPQASVVVDSDLIADLGLTHQAVGTSLGAAMGGDYTNYFSISGRTYKVIPQTLQVDRLNPEQVLDNYIRTPGNALIPAATVASLTRQVVPESINHFQQLNSATISGVFSPTVSQEEVLAFMRMSLKEVAPVGFQIDHSGVSRQFVKESGGFMTTMLVALIIVFLALAAQFNSFRDPVIILVSVPMALFGALVFINLGVASINIYTQVGLVTLVGLVSKHGILIVEFANELQKAGKTKLEAILEATSIRLRPILMTTAAMVLGVFPLVIASGAGAAGRQAMGWVIFAGLSIGTLFTLFVVPAFYVLLGADLKGDFER
jgi:multidrug efflux pump